MGIRTSFSQSSTFVKCGKHWEWKYYHKYDAEKEGSSLYFGSAVDAAVMHMLEDNIDFLSLFASKWESTEKRKGKEKIPFQIFDNDDIIYSYNDFDEYVMQEQDLTMMKTWAEQAGLDKLKPVEAFKKVAAKKKSRQESPTPTELKYFNRCSWLSLKRKGDILIRHFYEEFYPKITKVHETQKFAQIKDEETGDGIMGALDFVAEIKGYDKPIIFDLKTAARPYSEENINLSEQLPLYLALSQGKYKTDLVGYVVLVKQMQKIDHSVCKVCGHKKTGRHKTCDNVIDGERCGGEWKDNYTLKPQLQVIVRKKTQADVDKVLTDQGNILAAMRNKIIFRNLDMCNNWFGGKCAYYDACHKGDLTGLKKKY